MEQLGKGKIGESLPALLRAAASLATEKGSFGQVSVHIGDAVSLSEFVPASVRQRASPGFDPHQNPRDRRVVVAAAAEEMTRRMQAGSRSTPTHLAASLLLMHREGIPRRLLLEKMEWLGAELRLRGGKLDQTQGELRAAVLPRAVALLGGLVTALPSGMVEPNIRSRSQYGNMIELGYYRNHILRHFEGEAMLALSLYRAAGASLLVETLLEDASFLEELTLREWAHPKAGGYERAAAALRGMLERGTLAMEAVGVEDAPGITRPAREAGISPSIAAASAESGADLHAAAAAGFGPVGKFRVRVSPQGEAVYGLMCSLLWPFVDGYYVAALSLSVLRGGGSCGAGGGGTSVDRAGLLERMQWLGDRLYQDGLLYSFEGCSVEVLGNAMRWLEEGRVIETRGEMVRLGEGYRGLEKEEQLEALMGRLASFRRRVPGLDASHLRASLVAELPMLARL